MKLEEKYVRCPRCSKPALLSTKNIYRPFCCERCRTLDLGAWADEKYAVPVAASAIDEDPIHADDSEVQD